MARPARSRRCGAPRSTAGSDEFISGFAQAAQGRTGPGRRRHRTRAGRDLAAVRSDSLSRALQVQAAGATGATASSRCASRGPAAETFKLEADIDATDQLEFPGQNPPGEFGISRSSPCSSRWCTPPRRSCRRAIAKRARGRSDRADAGAAHAVRVGQNRIVPVKVTDFSVTEEAFDPSLNPIRAKVSLGLRVMSTDDLTFSTKAEASSWPTCKAERLAGKVQSTRPGRARDQASADGPHPGVSPEQRAGAAFASTSR